MTLLKLAMLLPLFLAAPAFAQEQLVDPDFKPTVASPAYKANGPVIAIDEAHDNFHTMNGNYRPFADLMQADGYRVRASTSKFTAETFKGVDVFVIVNAEANFEDAESDALRDWVRAGGSLLLTADHAPFGAYTESLAIRFGVTMGKGWAYDSETKGKITTQLTCSRDNWLLGDLSGNQPILEGRNPSERIGSVKTFTGQSLGMPPGAKALLRFSPTAHEAPDQAKLNTVEQDVQRDGGEGLYTSGGSPSIAGRVQGMAMPFGKGRVVVLGEAGMFSAQVIKFPPGANQADIRFGMQMPGTDDKQFARNIMHWLSGALK